MDHINRLSAYFNEKERKRLDAKAKQNHDGLPEMTFDEIKLSCLENGGYETPELNDKIYLHFKGFKKIENLDKFTGCKAIWLDSNGFNKIENLEPLQELRCLYLSKNLIGSIENIHSLKNLTILDLSYNRLTHIDNLSMLPTLQTVNLSHNFLVSPDSIKHLQECHTVTTVDLTNNRLENTDKFYEVFKGISSMVTLSVNGNDITKQPGFRKHMLAHITQLGYLDRPVEAQERRFAIAYVNGGPEAESAERAAWKKEQEEERLAKRNEFKAWQDERRRARDTAKAEGRSLITEFTPEEQEQRAAEAQAAHDAEQRILELGIGKLATKYWEMEGKVARGVDALDAATDALLAEKDAQSKETPQEVKSAGNQSQDDEVDVSEIAVTVEENGATEVDNASEPSPSRSESTVEVDIDENIHDDSESARTAEVTATEQDSDVLTTCVAVDETKSEELATSVVAITNNNQKELEEEQLRQERVAESFLIYKQQLEDSKKGITGNTHRNTWDNSINDNVIEESVVDAEEGKDEDDSRPLFWTEEMDIEMAKLVKQCFFDFDEVSEEMIAHAKSNVFYTNNKVTSNPELLTSEVCRMRWADLDAAQWSEENPESSILETEYKICINPAVLGNGHGAQPTFEALAGMTAGSLPAYLTPPSAFPTVADMDEDSDLDLD